MTTTYESPRIEKVLSELELQREILYAGLPSPIPQ